MRLLKGLFLLTFLCMMTFVKGQDIHYTMYEMSPLTLNPALTGAYEGSFRIGGIYRDQWRSIIENQYQTPSVYLDAPVFRGFGKSDWVGLGVMVLNDKAGTSEQTNLTAMLSAAYHLGLGQKKNSYLSLGVQGGIVQRRINTANLIFEDQYDGQGGFTMGTQEDFENDKVSYPDIQAGIALNSFLSRKVSLNIGFSAFHLTTPKDIYLKTSSQTDEFLPMRLSGQAGMDIDVGKRFALRPGVFVNSQSAALEINAKNLFGYHLNAERDITFLFGGGYRIDDAAYAQLGMDIKNFRVGAAYDFNVSQLNSSTNSRGAFEVGLAYIAKISRTPVVKPVLFCPRF